MLAANASANANAETMAEPFITLSSASSSTSADGGGVGNTTESPNTSPSDSFDEATPPFGPLSATHDTRRADYHVKDLETFARDLQNAADRAFPNEGRAQSRYSNVSVLLLRWEEDEMNVEWELDDLGKVFRDYGFETERWLIPSKNSHLKLMSKVVDVVEKNDGSGNLVIVYYAGHACINSSRGATWTCKQDPAYASLEWSAIQTLFEKADFDVLQLLDCCAAASAAPAVGSAVTETIAACGFESIAPLPGRYSFTNALIEVLEDWIDSPPFSAAMLHNQILSILKHERPERMHNGKRRKLECRRTPIHMVATADPTLPSIELGRRPPRRDGISGPTSATPTSNAVPRAGEHGSEHTPRPSSSTEQGYQQKSVNHIRGDEYEVPRVIISLALEKHQKLSSESCQKWLTSCPTLVKYAKIEAVYNSFSALLLLSIPVFIWNLLPENVAYSFVGYVTSSNFLGLGRGFGSAAKNIASFSQQETTSAQADTLKELPRACDRCYENKIDCDGRFSGCKMCGKTRSDCVYSPAWRREGPAKAYIDDLHRQLAEAERTLDEERSRKATVIKEYPPSSNFQGSKQVTLPSFQSLSHNDYKSNAAAYDKSLLHRLDGHRRKGSNSYSEPSPTIRETSLRYLACPDPTLRRTLSPVSISHEQSFSDKSKKPSAAEDQMNEFMRQERLERDAVCRDSAMAYVPLPLPPPRHLPEDNEVSWNDKKLAWIAPKSEYVETSGSPLLLDRKTIVKTESNLQDSKDWYGPPEKKMKISSMTEPRHMGSGGGDTARSPGKLEITGKKKPHTTGTKFFNRDIHSYESKPRTVTGDEVGMGGLGQSQPDNEREKIKGTSEPGTQIHATFEPPKNRPYSPNRTTNAPTPQNITTYVFRRTPEQPLRESSPPPTKTHAQPQPVPHSQPNVPNPSTVSPRTAPPDQDWTYITDIAERRRIQNRIAQRNYRKRMKRRLEDLEDRAGASASGSGSTSQSQSQPSSSAPSQASPVGAPESGSRYPPYTAPYDEPRNPSRIRDSGLLIAGDLQPSRSGLGDTMGRYMPEGGPESRPEPGLGKDRIGLVG